jgi:hypothetical protein
VSTSNVIAPPDAPSDSMRLHRQPGTVRSYGSTILDSPIDVVWEMVRDFNNYPAYVDGVTESHLEDDKAGDEVGAVRCFIYNGAKLRQKLIGHSDAQRWFTHTGCEPLQWPGEESGVEPVTYENAVRLFPLTESNQTFAEWWLDFTGPGQADLALWKDYFDSSIPLWFDSLRQHVEPQGEKTVLIVGLNLKAGITPEEYETFAREVDKPTCERDLPSIREWHVHRAESVFGSDQASPFDYVEVVELTSESDFKQDIASDVVAKLDEGLSRLVEDPVLIMTRQVA